MSIQRCVLRQSLTGPWSVVVTVDELSQALNRAWILLQDFEYSYPDDKDGSWVLLTSTTLPNASPRPTRMLTRTEPICDHDTARLTLGDISNIIRLNESQLTELDITPYLWII